MKPPSQLRQQKHPSLQSLLCHFVIFPLNLLSYHHAQENTDRLSVTIDYSVPSSILYKWNHAINTIFVLFVIQHKLF